MAEQLTNFKIDQAATFAGVVFVQCDPKMEMGTSKQARTNDGIPKWDVQIMGAQRPRFEGGASTNTVLKVGVASHTNPADAMPHPFCPIVLIDLEVGVMERTKKNPDGSEKVIGVQTWMRASEVRSAADTAPRTSKAA